MDKDRLKPQPHVVIPKELLSKEKNSNDKLAFWIGAHVGSMYCF